MASKNLIIIGGGMGGYGAAIRAAQLGAAVTLVEKDTLGGTCLNRGCIPTKTLLQSADLFSLIKGAGAFGITAGEVSLNFGAVMKRKQAVVSQLVSGVNYLMTKNKVRVIKGTATIVGPGTVRIAESKETLRGDAVIIATGSRPASLPIPVGAQDVITSDDALSASELPPSLFIIGGGVIGVELAQIFSQMGSKVTVCELMPQILPTEDAEVALALTEVLTKSGIEVLAGAKVTGIEPASNGDKKVRFTSQGREEERTASRVLVAIGRRPCTEKLGLNEVGVKLNRDRIVTDNRMETSVPAVYAVGDAVGKLMLAHVAMSEGICAAENIMGMHSTMNYGSVPRCTYTSPEIASVGLTEAEAKKQRSDIKTVKFPFTANGRALTLGKTQGMVKLVTGSHGELVGATIIGPEATELIAEIALAMQLELTADDIASCIHAHPTLSEVVKEAAMRVEGRAIHV